MDDERAAYREKLKSLNFGSSFAPSSKTTIDVHDNHTVEVRESGSDRVDVTVKAPTTILQKGPLT